MSSNKTKWRVILGTSLLFPAYASAALWLKQSYVPVERPKGAVLQLISFKKLAPNGFAYRSPVQRPRDLADSPAEPARSPAVIFEDGKPLGPAHSALEDIERIGLGRFSHLKNFGYIFSTSDNSDPATNGRKYWVVLPDAVGNGS
jgi:hypothetical protein